MKKLFSVILMTCVIFCFTACNMTENNSDIPVTQTPTSTLNTHPSISTDIPDETSIPTDPTLESHIHNYCESITKQAGCTTSGLHTYTCSCQDSYTEFIPATGHRWNDWIIIKEPTGYTEGLSKRSCRQCTAEESKIIVKRVSDEELQQIEEGLIKLINSERNRLGAAPLILNNHLDDVAQIRSGEINSLWSHTRLNGEDFSSLVDKNIYSYSIIWEAICMTSHVGNNILINDPWTGSDTQIKAAYSFIMGKLIESLNDKPEIISNNYKNYGIGISYQMSETTGKPFFFVSLILGA